MSHGSNRFLRGAARSCGSGRRSRRRVLSSLLFVFALSAAASTWARCDIKQFEIPVRMVNQRPIASLTLNGTEVPLLVDSGAFFSMLSESTATQLGLPLRNLPRGMRIDGYTGRIDAMMTRVETVGLLGVQLSRVDFVVGGNELGAGIMGLLGRNILSIADTEYDLARGVVRLSFPKGDCAETNFAHWAGEAPVIEAPLEETHRTDTAIRVQVKINGKRTKALLDTGAPQTALTLNAARRAGIEEGDLTPYGRTGGAGEGQAKSWTGRVAVFELGGEKITNSRLRVDDVDSSDHGIVLGLDYFLSHRIYVARSQQKIYATWNGGATFALARTTKGEYDARYAALPQDVSKDDADALARRGAAAIAAGDHQRALEDLNRACELAPGVAEYFFTRARLHLAMRQAGPALGDLDQALRLDPTLAEARYRRARLHASLGNRQSAQVDMVQLDASLPPSSHLRADIAEFYASFGQVDEALRQFDLWVNTHRNDARLASVLNSRCWMRARLNIELPLALKDCEQAVDIDDGASAYRDSLGWIYLRLGDASRARKAFDGAIKLEARPFSLYGRALAHRRLNDMASSEQDLAAARKAKPSIDEDVRKAGFEFADAAVRPGQP
ncbi:MAG: retroviral-like aspartic protease family protein, partial [Burkholderiales bacterium]|nr:retroviral-like aspartic protease family protein [Burkholderiales bacterium]